MSSTNGLDLFPYLDDLAKNLVSHLTITINSIKSETLAKLYCWNGIINEFTEKKLVEVFY